MFSNRDLVGSHLKINMVGHFIYESAVYGTGSLKCIFVNRHTLMIKESPCMCRIIIITKCVIQFNSNRALNFYNISLYRNVHYFFSAGRVSEVYDCIRGR